MNRKNLTAAVLAGLAGAAGIAGTAQAVNLNPDGLGQVLIYPYYTSNAGNETLLSVVNTTDSAKAVKVRFKEGYNSREVLDFNLYMSAYDVWVASVSDSSVFGAPAGTPHLFIPDSTCTVPYLYEEASTAPGLQEFLDDDYTGSRADGGPTTIARAAEGYFEMIEMGTLTNEEEDSAKAATHVIDDDGVQAPADCQQLVDAWTENPDGYWIDDETIDISRNSGGLFGGASIINIAKGTMSSYDAKAIQGYSKASSGNHFKPGNSLPSLNDGSENDATIFFGVPKDEAVTMSYPRPVDAISAVFMHEYTMNEYSIEAVLNAASEWVITFPTKNFYVDRTLVPEVTRWIPDSNDPGCGGWEPGDELFPARSGPDYTDSVNKTDINPANAIPDVQEDWVLCSYIEIDETGAVPPFTSLFDGSACEVFFMDVWDREENADDTPNKPKPPVVSPPPQGGSTPEEPNEMCYEVNVLRFGNDGVYRPVFGTTSALLKTVDTGDVVYDDGDGSKPREAGWARIDWGFDSDHVDWNGLVGLPVTGFWALQFENGFRGTPQARVLSNYGGLFQHKGNVKRVSPRSID